MLKRQLIQFNNWQGNPMYLEASPVISSKVYYECDYSLKGLSEKII